MSCCLDVTVALLRLRWSGVVSYFAVCALLRCRTVCAFFSYIDVYKLFPSVVVCVLFSCFLVYAFVDHPFVVP